MSSLTGRYRAFRASPHFHRIWKFGTVSLIATAVSQLILFAVYPHVISSAMASNVVATSVSTVPAYYLNRRWTWGKRGRSHLLKEVVPFWTMAFIGLVLSTVIVGIAAKSAHFISSSEHVKVIIVHLANLFAYALIWVARYTILNRYLFGTHTHSVGATNVVDTVAVERQAPAAGPSAEESTAGATPTIEGAAATEPILIHVDPSR
jgi:putative flippase GtrA